jgi:hypothetical protein
VSRYDAWLAEELEDVEAANDVEPEDPVVDDEAGDLAADRYFGGAA